MAFYAIQRSSRPLWRQAFHFLFHFFWCKELTFHPGGGKDHPAWNLGRLEMHAPAPMGCGWFMGHIIMDT